MPSKSAARRRAAVKTKSSPVAAAPAPTARPSALLDTRIVYCGDCLDQLKKLPDACIDLIYIDPPFNSNRNYEVFWVDRPETRPQWSGSLRPSEPRAQWSGLRRFEDRHASTVAYIDYMRPHCVELARPTLRCRKDRTPGPTMPSSLSDFPAPNP